MDYLSNVSLLNMTRYQDYYFLYVFLKFYYLPCENIVQLNATLYFYKNKKYLPCLRSRCLVYARFVSILPSPTTHHKSTNLRLRFNQPRPHLQPTIIYKFAIPIQPTFCVLRVKCKQMNSIKCRERGREIEIQALLAKTEQHMHCSKLSRILKRTIHMDLASYF